MNGNCRLCGAAAELRNSHILPEFLYRPAYDAIHRAVRMTAQAGRQRFLQQGYYERLLCDGCEGRLNRFETYFAEEWYEQGKLPANLTSPVLTIPGLDYARFKLFHLSIIWRAGISQREEFRHVKLGPHEDVLRRMLLDQDPGPPEAYPFWGRILFDPTDSRVTGEIIVEPVLSRVEAHFIYIFTFGGCAWYYFISSHDPGNLVPVRFDRGGELTLVAENVFTFPPIADFISQYRRARGT